MSSRFPDGPGATSGAGGVRRRAALGAQQPGLLGRLTVPGRLDAGGHRRGRSRPPRASRTGPPGLPDSSSGGVRSSRIEAPPTPWAPSALRRRAPSRRALARASRRPRPAVGTSRCTASQDAVRTSPRRRSSIASFLRGMRARGVSRGGGKVAARMAHPAAASSGRDSDRAAGTRGRAPPRPRRAARSSTTNNFWRGGPRAPLLERGLGGASGVAEARPRHVLLAEPAMSARQPLTRVAAGALLHLASSSSRAAARTSRFTPQLTAAAAARR